jgi:hypothetical protein
MTARRPPTTRCPSTPEFASLDRSLVLLNGVLSAPFQDYLRQQVATRPTGSTTC